MGERRYGVGSRGRFPLPRPRSRDFNPSRHDKHSPYRRGGEEYSRNAERPRRVERRDRFDRDHAPRFHEYENRDGDRHVADGRRYTSPRRIKKTDKFETDVSMRAGRLSDYEDGSKGIFKNEDSGGHSRRLYGEDSYRGDSRSTKFPLDRPVDGYRRYDHQSLKDYRHTLDEDSYRGDSNSAKFSLDHPEDGHGRSDHPSLKDYRHARDYTGVSDANVASGVGERDYYSHGRYSDSGQAGLLGESQYLDSTKLTSMEYERGERMDSHPYTSSYGRVGHIPKSGGDGSSHMSSVASQYLRTDADKQGYLNVRDELHLEKRDEGLYDRELRDFEKKNDIFHSQDSFLGREKMVGTEKYKLKMDELHLEKRDGGLYDHKVGYFEKKNDGFHSQDSFLGKEKIVGTEMYKLKRKDDMVPLSQPKDYVSVSSDIVRESFPGYLSTEDLHMPSRMIQRGSGLASEPIGFDGYSEKKKNVYSGHGDKLGDTSSTSKLYYGLPEEKYRDQLYAEFGTSRIDGMTTKLNDVEEEYVDQHRSRFDVTNPKVDEWSLKNHVRDSMTTRLNDVEEKYIDQHRSRFGVTNPEVDEWSLENHVRDDGMVDKNPSLQRRSTTPNKFDTSGYLLKRNQDLDLLGAGSSHLHYENEEYRGYRSVKREEHHPQVDGVQWSHVKRSDIFQSRGYDPSLGRLYDSPRNRLAVSDLSLDEPSEMRLTRKHVRDEMFSEHDVGIRISTDGHGARKIFNQVDIGDEIDAARFLKKAKSSKYNHERTWRASGEMANEHPSSLRSYQRRSVKPASRDIKKRLGPVHQKLHVSQRIVDKYKPSVKKRLAPPPKCAPPPWLKNVRSKLTTSVRDESGGSPRHHGGDHLGDDLPLAKPEPPEKSEDFKQLLRSAFFKFLKQINETPAKRAKYREQGKAGTLKCIVCDSNSDEFVKTESLAMHAFTCKKVGLRSQHLGFHKALCVLMGWKITEDPTSEWRCEAMSNDEASALKEDLIIWPPVVIVHNSTIENRNPDNRVVVSTEKLDIKLRDMGFESILKICNGKPANQSVMLVKFNGTLSGLREAERFHKSYVESKRGRDELKQLRYENASSSGGTQQISVEREEDFVYGHIGIVEDLDKLDFDTKKRCVLRSKKEILIIVDVPFHAEGEN